MTDFNNIRWTLSQNFTYKVEKRSDYYTIKFDQFKGVNPNIIRIDLSSESGLNGVDYGTCKISTPIYPFTESFIYSQKLFFGTNLIIIPSYIENIENIYISQYKYLIGNFGIAIYQPSVQILINPFTNQPVILGQESLGAIEDLTADLKAELITELSQNIQTKLETTLQNITILEQITQDKITQLMELLG